MEAYNCECEFAEMQERITTVRIPMFRCSEDDVLDTTWKRLATEMSQELSEIRPSLVSSRPILYSVISIAAFQMRISCISYRTFKKKEKKKHNEFVLEKAVIIAEITIIILHYINES